MRNHLRGRRQEMASWCASLKRRDWPESLLTSSACGHTRILRGTGFWKKKTNPPHPSGAAGRGHSLAGREKAAWGESSLMLSFVSFMGHGCLSLRKATCLLSPHSLSPETYFLSKTALLPKQAATRDRVFKSHVAAILIPSTTAVPTVQTPPPRHLFPISAPLVKAMEGCFGYCVGPV